VRLEYRVPGFNYVGRCYLCGLAECQYFAQHTRNRGNGSMVRPPLTEEEEKRKRNAQKRRHERNLRKKAGKGSQPDMVGNVCRQSAAATASREKFLQQQEGHTP
jgi:hypothetical protein